MVKEVEVKNTTEILDSDVALLVDPENVPDIVTAILSDDGQTMTVLVNRVLKRGFLRKVTLSFVNVTYEQQLTAEYELGSFGPSSAYDYDTEHIFDLSPVLTEIIQTVPEQLADDTVSVRLYTYEANTAFNYGDTYPQYSAITTYNVGDYVQYGGRLWQCILESTGNLPTVTKYWNTTGVPSSGTMQFNVPYTVSYPGTAVVPQSTDGWYVIRISDIAEYSGSTAYVEGDLVWYSNSGYGLYECNAASTGNLPSDTTHWTAWATEEEYNMFEFGHEASDTITTILNTNMLVTRYVKQKHIYELLVKTNYKKHDDIQTVNQLEKITAMREAAVIHLYDDNPIEARHMLDLMSIEFNSYTTNLGNHTVIQTVTNFTI